MSGYIMMSIDDLPPEEAARVRADIEEAERGYTIEQLDEFARKHRGRPLSVGFTPADSTIRVRLDGERQAKLNRFMVEHSMTQSEAVRTLLDKALVDA